MHCLVEFHDNKREDFIGKDADGGWSVYQYVCPVCSRMNLFLVTGDIGKYPSGSLYIVEPTITEKIAIRPFGTNRAPCPQEVPEKIANDYKEACLILSFSPKASAALSRRCLQNLLRNAAKVKPKNLSKEIQEVIDDGKLPSQLAESIDAIRNIGNFAAHPIKSDSTGEIVDVEPEEAEWTLDVLESLFDFYYVQPAVIAKKRAALNVKLQGSGNPAMK
jgi:hypothetical protein